MEVGYKPTFSSPNTLAGYRWLFCHETGLQPAEVGLAE